MTLTNSPASTGKSLLKAILIAGLIAGTLDIAAAITNYMINGGNKPESVLKYIASGLVGKKRSPLGIV